MKQNSVKDMTAGTPWKLILSFALPLIAANIFQQLYTVVDTMVVGQVLGVKALAALGAIDWYNWMSLATIQGFTQGFGILVARRFGEKNYKALNNAIANAYTLSLILAAVFLVIMQLSIEPTLALLRIPLDIRPLSSLYLRIVFGAIPVTVAYNCLAVILRSLGDSRSPMVAVVISTISNILLDILFVCVFGWGVAGAAIATVIGQVISAVYCFYKIKKIELIRESMIRRVFDKCISKEMILLGTPIAFQNIIIAVGGMFVQMYVDTYGVVFIAGYTATNKLFGLLEGAGIAFGYAMVTYVSQNLGALEYQRIRRGVRSTLVISWITCILIGVVMIVFGKWILGLFIAGPAAETAEALGYAYGYLTLLSIFLTILYALHTLRSALQGLGNTKAAMVSGIAELFVRVGCVLILPVIWGKESIFVSEVLAWAGGTLSLLISYVRYWNHNKDNKMARH